MKKIAIYIFVLVVMCHAVKSAELGKDFQSFDSLLFQENFDVLLVELDTYTKSLPAEGKNTIIVNKINKYYQIINYKENFANKDESVLINFIESKKTENELFSQSFAGQRAYEHYQHFLINAESDTKHNAAKSYFIANYFRALHIESTLVSIKEVYRIALEKYRFGNFEETDEYIQANKFDPGNNFTLNSYHDSLSTLAGIVSRKLEFINNKELYWNSTNKLQKNWFVSVGIQQNFQYEQKDLIFDFTDQTPPTFYSKGINSKRNNFGFSFEIIRNLSESFGIGSDFMMSKLKYRSEFDLNLIYFDYSYNIVSTHLKTVYYLRKHVGFRPYIAVGGGYFRAKRDESEVNIISLTPTGEIVDTYTLPKKTISSFQSLYEFGMQFVTNENSKIFFDINMVISKNHKKDPAIKSSMNSIAITVGLLF